MLSIGELSKRTGVKVPTIRYYENAGLLDAPERTEGNQRRYGDGELERLTFIRHARDLGLAVSAIQELIRLGDHPAQPCADADRIARDHLRAIREKIRRLKRLERELARIAGNCEAGNIAECRVIRALSDHSLCGSDHA
jgi:DNA-binding transcriptional MerR regulator